MQREDESVEGKNFKSTIIHISYLDRYKLANHRTNGRTEGHGRNEGRVRRSVELIPATPDFVPSRKAETVNRFEMTQSCDQTIPFYSMMKRQGLTFGLSKGFLGASQS